MRIFRWLTQALHYVSGLVLIGLMLLTVGDVVGRYGFNRPITGTYELTGLLAALAVFLGYGFAHVTREHITIDLVYEAVSPRVQRVLDLFATAVTVAALVALVWGLRHYAGRMDAGGYTTSVLKVPIGPFVWGAVIGTAAYGIAAAGDLVDFVRRLATGAPDQRSPHTPIAPDKGGLRSRDP